MKHFKFLIINIIAFSLLFFFFSLLFPGQVVTSKTISINVPEEKVKEKILATQNWKEWTPLIKANNRERQNWIYMDTMIFSVENNHHTDLSTQFVFYTEQGNSTLLNWAVIEKLPWYKPWKKFSAMVLGKQVAAVMDTSLAKFKAQIETGK
jgi:hypothetical protein